MFFFFKQKTAYEMRISDWSSDVCSSDLDDALVPSSATAGIAPTESGSNGTARRPSVPPCHPGGLTSGGQPQILHHMVNYIPSLDQTFAALGDPTRRAILDRKSTRLNSSH